REDAPLQARAPLRAGPRGGGVRALDRARLPARPRVDARRPAPRHLRARRRAPARRRTPVRAVVHRARPPLTPPAMPDAPAPTPSTATLLLAAVGVGLVVVMLLAVLMPRSGAEEGVSWTVPLLGGL